MLFPMSDLKYWLGFNLVKGIGAAKVQALLSYFGDLESAWNAREAQLQRIGFDQRTLESFQAARAELNLDACLERVRTANVDLLTWNSPGYPDYLREIDAPPPLLYVRGQLAEIDRWAVGVVGTRRLTTYGRQVTHDLVAGLVRSGVTIVSGLARGIDGIAHRTALEMGGRTIGVLGSGVDRIYPSEHRELAAEIANGRGAIISEYALGEEPDAKHFPPRNRLISGLSLGVLVIEAGEQSGALITTRFALEQGREVFAVPGNITSPSSAGTNRLIQQGAKLVRRADDILEELNLHMVLEKTAVQAVLPATPAEATLIAHLSAQPVHIDDLSRATGMPSGEVSSTLTLMELKGMVRQVGGMNYVMSREPDPVYDLNDAQKD
jgi:DNA processing protein